MDAQTIVARLTELGDPSSVAGMARYGINVSGTLGVAMPIIRGLAKEILAAYPRKDPALHDLAGELWGTGIHEARILAGLIDLPEFVTPEQMERWALDFDSWDVVDQTCASLFDQTSYAVEKAIAWSERPEEYVKRAGFVLMAILAHKRHRLPDVTFIAFLPLIEREAADERNFVRKAVNWALRQIGKRNLSLRALAITTAEKILLMPSRSARWVASDALQELRPKGQG